MSNSEGRQEQLTAEGLLFEVSKLSAQVGSGYPMVTYILEMAQHELRDIVNRKAANRKTRNA